MVLMRPKLLLGDMLVMTEADKPVCQGLIICCHATNADSMTANDHFLVNRLWLHLEPRHLFTHLLDVFRARRLLWAGSEQSSPLFRGGLWGSGAGREGPGGGGRAVLALPGLQV